MPFSLGKVCVDGMGQQRVPTQAYFWEEGVETSGSQSTLAVGIKRHTHLNIVTVPKWLGELLEDYIAQFWPIMYEEVKYGEGYGAGGFSEMSFEGIVRICNIKRLRARPDQSVRNS